MNLRKLLNLSVLSPLFSDTEMLIKRSRIEERLIHIEVQKRSLLIVFLHDYEEITVLACSGDSYSVSCPGPQYNELFRWYMGEHFTFGY